MTKIVHVIPSQWGAHVDIRACLESLARRRPMTEVITPHEFMSVDPKLDALFICWTLVDVPPKDQRDYKVASIYSEALDSDGAKLLPAHLLHWHKFKDHVPHLDAVFTHTPRTAEIIRHVGLPAFVMPVGWDVEAMGAPRWRTTKHIDLVYHGSMAGRREVIIPYLTKHLKSFANVSGAFGRSLLGHIDTARASLYIAHSLVESFSTWRLWQVASTSAALIAEIGDTWPFEPDKHYIPIDPMTLDGIQHAAFHLEWLTSRHEHLNSIANEAHKLALHYTVDRVEDEFVIPAMEKLR